MCAGVGLGFDEAMLSWPAGPKEIDGAWAPAWYDNVHKSTGFASYVPKTNTIPKRLQPVVDEAMSLYERLAEYAVQ